MVATARQVMRGFDYDHAPFNMEFFWNRRSDGIRLLEVNSRISKSHCPLFRMVDGASNQQVMVDCALGVAPDFPHRQGDFRVAGKFMIRVQQDGVLRREPSEAELSRIRERFPEARIKLLAREGMRLADLPYQDSYSFELAELFLGADSQRELLEKYQQCVDWLTFDVTPQREAA
jgi:biotin carboxylase